MVVMLLLSVGGVQVSRKSANVAHPRRFGMRCRWFTRLDSLTVGGEATNGLAEQGSVGCRIFEVPFPHRDSSKTT